MSFDVDKKRLAEDRKNYLYILGTTTGSEFDKAKIAARSLAKKARGAGIYDELGIIADRLRFYDENDAQLHVWSAQSLVNRNMPLAARDVLHGARDKVLEGDDLWFELQGLLGRCAKQIFLDSPDRTTVRAREFLAESLQAYRAAYDRNPAKAYWHGGNIAALLTLSRALGYTPAESPEAFSNGLKQTLDGVPQGARDWWWQASYAEAELGCKRLAEAAERTKICLDTAEEPFPIESLLRQLTEVWDLDRSQAPPMAKAMVGLLRVKLLQWEGEGTRGPAVQVTAAEVAGYSDQKNRQQNVGDLQKAFGADAPKLMDWWNLGTYRAKSIAAICGKDEMGRLVRKGTGFLVRLRHKESGTDAGCFVLTNAHVVGDPDPKVVAISSWTSAKIRFEGHDPDKTYSTKGIVWTSPLGKHDATLLEIEGALDDLKPIPVSQNCPAADSESRLYVIGYAGGNELSFSFQDNRLLDHEAPPSGHPREPGVVLVHYETPTTNGSSGSPVFVESQWTAIALHHSGSAAMQRLNGQPGTYRANEGISLASISCALAAEKNLELWF